MLINVIFVYIVCWFFNYVLYFLIFYVQVLGFYYGLMVYIIIVLLVFFNVVVDFLMYMWYMDDFRRGICGVFCCCY